MQASFLWGVPVLFFLCQKFFCCFQMVIQIKWNYVLHIQVKIHCITHSLIINCLGYFS